MAILKGSRERQEAVAGNDDFEQEAYLEVGIGHDRLEDTAEPTKHPVVVGRGRYAQGVDGEYGEHVADSQGAQKHVGDTLPVGDNYTHNHQRQQVPKEPHGHQQGVIYNVPIQAPTRVLCATTVPCGCVGGIHGRIEELSRPVAFAWETGCSHNVRR